MRKKEYIHTHALLAETARYLTDDETLSAERFSAYAILGTRATSIHKSKQNHHEAVMILSSAIESGLDEARTETPEQPVNR